MVSVFNFLLTPIHIAVSGLNSAAIVVTNYTLVILGSSLIASNSKSKTRTYLLGMVVLVFIWLEFSSPHMKLLTVLRLLSSFVLFVNFCLLLIDQLKKMKTVSLEFIMGPLLGFIYLGIIGGILFETTHLIDPASFDLMKGVSGYTFYYFSFISITTVGYGDITPLTPPAQSLTMVMNIIGQFYLAIVIGVYVGKYINVKS